MKFRLGEFVRFVDEKREGYITRIFNDDLIGVTGNDDFEIPVPVNKVTRVHGYEYANENQQASSTETAVPVTEFQKTGIYLAVVPDQSKGSVVSFHILNRTSFQIAATLNTYANQRKGEFIGIIAPKSTANVFTANLSELSAWPSFYFQFVYYTTQNIELPQPLISKQKFAAKHFSGAKETIPYLKQSGWLIQLDQEEITIDPEKLKESFFKPKAEKADIEKPKKEIDLHIEKLRDDYQFLNSNEILDIQLDVFRKTLDAAIVHKLPSITFIHGVGNGTLRHEIHKVVSKHPQIRTFMDAHKERFGYGATEIVFK